MSFNRLAFAAIIILVLLWGGTDAGHALAVMGLYSGLALAVLAHIIAFPGASPLRRGVALALDVTFLSWQLHIGGETVSAFFPIYLWITFGNGFRFGLPALWSATALSFAAFAAVIATTPFWREQSHLSTGLLVSLVILPAYSGTLIRRLSKARLEAEQASEAKTMFLANVSHELRTPLTAIIGMGALLRGSSLDDGQREMTETVESAATSLLALIDDILQVSRIDAGRQPSDRASFDLVDLVASVRRLVAAQAAAKGLRLAVHIAPDVPCRLVADERRIRQILVNLASNAVKFTETGGVLIAVGASRRNGRVAELDIAVTDTGIGIAPEAQGRIFDTFAQADSTIVNRFGGTGLGLAISKRLAVSMGGALDVESAAGQGSTFRLTMAVETAPPGPADASPSSGPALAVQVLAEGDARAWLVEQLAAVPAVVADRPSHGVQPAPSSAKPVLVACADGMQPEAWLIDELERLHASSSPHVVLVREQPLADASRLRWLCSSIVAAPRASERFMAELRAALHIAAAGRAPTPPEQAPSHDRALRVLVAEDNRVNQRVLKAILDRAGHHVVMVDDGEAALDALEAEETAFDIALMDVNMPVMDGLETTKLYRFMALGRPHVPIVALTADATEQMLQRSRAAGMDACLTKPIQPALLLKTIQHLALPGPSAAKPSGAVAAIVDHPRFRPSAGAVLDEQLLQNLTELGGEEFVAELMAQFAREADVVAHKLGGAVLRQDFGAVHDLVHALQSMGSNLGARALVELCMSWQALSHAQLVEQASGFAQRASLELAQVDRAFLARSMHQATRSKGLAS